MDLGGTNQSKSGVIRFLSGTTANGTITKSGADYDGQAGSVSAVLGGAVGLTKTTAGTLILSGANTYTGTTTINAGTLTLNRQTGSLDATTPLTFSGSGTFFNMDNTSASGALTQTLGALTFSAGQGTVQITRTAAFDQAITFASLTARTAGATGNFVNAGGTTSATNGFIFTSAPTAGALIDRGLFYNGSAYATYDSGGFVRGFTTGDTDYLAAPTGTSIGASTSSSNVDLTTGNITAQTTVSANTINMRNFNIAMTGTSQVLSTSGLLSSGSASATLGGGTTPLLQAGTAGGELVVRVNGSSDALNISSVIQNNTSASSLTKAGAGTLTLSGANTYTGATTINAGTLTVSGGSAIENTGAVIVDRGAVFKLGASETIGSIAGAGNVTLGANTLTTGGDDSSTTLSGVISGASGGLTKSGTGTLTLTGSNTYTGATTINAGTVNMTGGLGNFLGALQINAGTLNVTARINFGDATLADVAGATLDYTGVTGTHQVLSLSGGGANGGNLVLGNSLFITGSLSTSYAGIISGTGALVQAGTGTQTLSGMNTYTGTTSIQKGTLSVSSISSVNGGASNLGSPTTVAAGTIQIGTTTSAGTLLYTGSGHSTDRVVNLVGTTGGATLDASGSGALVFTSAFTATGAGAKTLTLTGTSTADNEIGGAIVNNGGPTSLTKSGTGKWILSGANTFTGATIVSDGLLTLSNSLALQNSALDTTACFVSSSATTGLKTTVTTLTFGGLSGNKDLVSLFDSTNGYGSVTTLTLNPGNTVSYSGAITNGAMNLIKSGAGTQTLSGTNTYGGTTTINAGILNFANKVSKTAAVATVAAAGSVGLGVKASDAAFYSATDVGDLFNGSLTGFTMNAASGVAIDTTNAGATFDQTVALTAARALTKLGTGTLSLSQTNTYTGTTTINEGTLALGVNHNLAGGLTFGSTTGTTTPGILDLTSASATFGGAMLVNTNSATASEINIGTAQTLTINGNVQIGATTPAITGTVTKLTMNGGGTFNVATAAAGTFIVGGSVSNLRQDTTLDLTALKATTLNLSATGVLKVGPSNNNTGGEGVLLLSNLAVADTVATTTITAGTIDLAAGDSNNTSSKITLGTGLTQLNVDTINVGNGSRDLGQMTFAGANGDLIIRAADGTGRATAINLATSSATTVVGSGANNTVDFSGHDADILVTSLNVGNSPRTGSFTSEFKFGEGNNSLTGGFSSKLDATNVNIGFRTGTGTVASSILTNKVSLSGGTVTFGNGSASGTGVDIGNNATNGVFAHSTVGELNISGGEVTINNGSGGFAVRLGTNSAGLGTVTASMNLTGGTTTLGGDIIKGAVSPRTTSTVKISGANAILDMGGFNIGSLANSITLTAESGTLKNVGEINGGGSLVKTTAGTLVLEGTNTYTGGTTLGAGTVNFTTGGLGTTGAVTFTGNSTLQYGASTTTDLSSRLAINTGVTGTVDTNGNNVTFATGFGASGSGALTKIGTGTLSLNAANTYTGLTTVNAGTLAIGSGGSLASGNALTLGASGLATFANAGQTLGAVSNANTTANALNFSASTGTVTLASLSGAGNTTFGSTAAIGTLSGGTVNLNGSTSAITTLNAGTVNLGASTTLTLSDGTSAGAITGTGGSLTKTSSGTLTLTGANTYTGLASVTQGTLVIGTAAGGNWAGNVTVSGSGTLKGRGTIAGEVIVNSGGTYSPGNSPAVQNIGALTVNSDVFVTIELDGPTAGTGSGFHDQIVSAGAVTLNGGTLNGQTVFSGSSVPAYLPTLGAVHAILSGSAVTGTFAAYDFSANPAGFSFLPEYTATAVNLYAVPTNYATAVAGLNANQTQVGAALQSLRNSALKFELDQRTTLDARATLFNGLKTQDAAGLRTAYDQLTPEKLTALAASTFQSASILNSSLQQRSAELRRFGPASVSLNGVATPAAAQDYRVETVIEDGVRYPIAKAKPKKRFGYFATATGAFAAVDGSSDRLGSFSQTGAATAGVDYAINETQSVGFVVSQALADTDFSSNSGTARTTTSRVGLFHDYHNGGFFVNTSVSAGFSAYDSKRKIAFLNQTASGETQGYSYGGQLSTGYDFKVGDFIVGPTASVAYDHAHINGFDETGSTADLIVRRQNADSLITKLGVHVSRPFVAKKIGWIPDLSLSASRQSFNPNRITARLAAGGDAIKVNPQAGGSEFINPGASLSALLPNGWTVRLSYDAILNPQSAEHRVNLSLNAGF